MEMKIGDYIMLSSLAACILVLAILSTSLRKRIERLEDRSIRTVDLIGSHLEMQHGIVPATNSTTLEISNSSSKTITVTLPNGVQWKETK